MVYAVYAPVAGQNSVVAMGDEVDEILAIARFYRSIHGQTVRLGRITESVEKYNKVVSQLNSSKCWVHPDAPKAKRLLEQWVAIMATRAAELEDPEAFADCYTDEEYDAAMGW